MAKIKSKVKSTSKVKPKNLVKNGLIATGVLGALTGIGFLGNKLNTQKNNLQKELDKTKDSVNVLTNSDKKNIELLNKCLKDIDIKEKMYKEIIEKLTKKIENDNKIIIDLNQKNNNLINENNELDQKFRNLQQAHEELERSLNNEKTTNFINSFF